MAVPNSIHRHFVKAESWFNGLFIIPLQKYIGMGGNNKTIVGKKPHFSQKEELFKILGSSSISETSKERIKEELKSTARYDKKSARSLCKQFKEILNDPTLSMKEQEAFILGLCKASAYLNGKRAKVKLENSSEDRAKHKENPNIKESHPRAVLDYTAAGVLMELYKLSLTADSMPLRPKDKAVAQKEPQPLTIGFANHRMTHKHHVHDPASFPQRVMEKPQQRDEQVLPQKGHHKRYHPS